jgi:nucleoside-diphosphate-sugar epimerase
VVVKVFCTGASGYIGGSVAARLIAAGHQVAGLVRSAQSGDRVRVRGIEPVLGTLDDPDVLAAAARASDLVLNAANADHRNSAIVMLDALAGTGKTFIHTSGSSIVGTRAGGERVDAIFDEATPFTPSPARAARVALNQHILSSTTLGVRSIVVCPSLIYGLGRGAKPHSMQVPWLIALARKHGVAKHIGSGSNVWSNVHIDDLVQLYMLAVEKAPAGTFYFAENGENSMRELCQAISRMLGLGGAAESMTVEQAAAEWGDGAANDTMGSNSRVRAVRARKELGWMPAAPSLLHEIEFGCYARPAQGA